MINNLKLFWLLCALKLHLWLPKWFSTAWRHPKLQCYWPFKGPYMMVNFKKLNQRFLLVMCLVVPMLEYHVSSPRWHAICNIFYYINIVYFCVMLNFIISMTKITLLLKSLFFFTPLVIWFSVIKFQVLYLKKVIATPPISNQQCLLCMA